MGALARAVALALAVAAGLALGPASGPRATAEETGLLAVRGARVHTQGPQGTLEDAVVVVRDGRIAEVGPASEVALPEGARVLEAPVVTPGLIDTHSVAGLSGLYDVPADQDQDETAGPSQAALRAIDAFHPRAPLLRWLLRHGVTVVQSGPGEANPIGGLAGVFKTHGPSVEAMTMRFPSALVLALGEPPKATYAPRNETPVTRMGTAAVIRKALSAAEDYAEARTESGEGSWLDRLVGGGGDEAPERDLGKEALARALRGEIPALFTARREDDLRTALRLGREFDLRVEIADGLEGYLMADALARADVPVHVGPVMERLAALETVNASLENAAILARAGVPVTFRSGYEDYVPKVRVVLFEAAVAAAHGLGPERALRALTIDAARRLEVADRVGSLEPGKHADLVLFGGDPFETTTRVRAVVVEGAVAHEAGERWRP